MTLAVEPPFRVVPAPDQAVLQLTGREHLVLDDPAAALWIEEGYVGIYLVHLVGGEPTGRREYLLTRSQKTLALGGSAEVEGTTVALMLAPVGPCRLRRRTIGETDAIEPETRDALIDWGLALSQSLGDTAPRAFADPSGDTEEAIAFPVGATFKAKGSTLSYVTVEAGTAAVLGDDAVQLGPGDGPLATSSAVWFAARDPGETRVRIRDAAGSPDLLPAACRRLTTLYLRRQWLLYQAREAAEAERLAEADSRRTEQRREAIRSLGFMRDELPPGADRRDPLALAIAMVCRQLATEFRSPRQRDRAATVHDQIHALTRSSNLRARRVNVSGRNWLDRDVGTLLVFRKSDEAPLVLACKPRLLGLKRVYEVFDAATGKTTRATSALYDEIGAEGYSFIAPLPVEEGKFSFLRLSKFSFSPFLGDIRLLLVLSLIGSLLGSIVPMIHFLIIDKIIPDGNRDLLLDLALAVGFLSLGMFVFTMSQSLISLRLQTALAARLQNAIIDRLLRLPTRFFRKFSSGELLKRALMINDVSVGMSMTVVGGVSALLSTALMLAVAFYYSSALAWIAVFAAVFSAVFSIGFSYLIRRQTLAVQIEGGRLFGFIMQMVQGVTKLQTAGAEDRAFAQWAQRNGVILRRQYKVARLRYNANLINTVIQSASTVALFYVAGKMVEQSQLALMISPLIPPLLTIGVFFAFQRAFSTVVDGVQRFFQSFISAHEQMAKRELVRPVLEHASEQQRDVMDPGRIDGLVELRNVAFRYDDEGPRVLDGVSIRAVPGEFIALVGPSGCGKSTVLKLILGFESPISGQVLIDGRNLATLDLGAVRRQIGVVLQAGRINAGTLFQSIAGASKITLEEAWAAAEDAGLADDIRAMPMGMHSLVPEGGTTLSGGQRQRLLIARALALSPRIVIFDEATSALDNRTQRTVNESLKRRKVTRIVVAHRLSSISDADRVYVLESGRVAETGTPTELLAADGLFRRLAARQTV